MLFKSALSVGLKSNINEQLRDAYRALCRWETN